MWFTDGEARAVARNVTAGCRGDLTPAQFDALTGAYMFGLEGKQLAHAKLLTFLELPDRLQRGFYNSIRIGHATWAPRDAADAHRDRQLRLDWEGGVS